MVQRSIRPVSDTDTLDVSSIPQITTRLSVIKRLAKVASTDILHGDLPLFAEW